LLRQVAGDRAGIDARLAAIRARGIPNAFGAQRFGKEGGNLDKALAMFAGRRMRREERSLLLSAARSALFNDVLARRIADGLVRAGLKQERRALRIAVPGLEWEWQDESLLRLAFALPSGAYATALLHELGAIHDVGG
jgi:tRNA(Glu) U13 pseudouridine synthase TruD